MFLWDFTRYNYMNAYHILNRPLGRYSDIPCTRLLCATYRKIFFIAAIPWQMNIGKPQRCRDSQPMICTPKSCLVFYKLFSGRTSGSKIKIMENKNCMFTLNDFTARTSAMETIRCVSGHRPIYLIRYSPRGKGSNRQISCSLEATRCMFYVRWSFWNLTDVSAVLLPRRLSNFGTILSY